MLSMGILEDWSTNTGAVYPQGMGEGDTKFGDETEAVRFTIKGVENLSADLKLRMFPVATGAGETNFTETRVQAKYEFGMGWARLIYTTLAASPVDSDLAGDWKLSLANTEIGAQLKFGNISPFFSMITRNEKSTDTAAGSPEVENKETETLIGLDFGLSDTQTITFMYITATKDTDSMDTPFAMTSIGLAAEFAYKPVAFIVSYASNSNNYKEASGDDTKYDASASTISAGAQYTVLMAFVPDSRLRHHNSLPES